MTLQVLAASFILAVVQACPLARLFLSAGAHLAPLLELTETV
jgi:hypothetical protein